MQFWDEIFKILSICETHLTDFVKIALLAGLGSLKGYYCQQVSSEGNKQKKKNQTKKKLPANDIISGLLVKSYKLSILM